MDRDQILAQLGAIRAICDALASGLLMEAAPASGACEHPAELRQDATTMRGARQFYCKGCKQIISGD